MYIQNKTVPDLVAAVKRCEALRDGRKLHSEAVAARIETDRYVSAALIKMYSKLGCMRDARDVFDKAVFNRDIVTWNSLILGYVENGQSSVALDLFLRIDAEPSYITFVAALRACACLASEERSEKQIWLEKGAVIHEQVRNSPFHSNLLVTNTLVDMYAKCGDMIRARNVFESMSRRNFVSWNCILLGYVENGESSLALELFKRMDCEPSYVTYIAGLKACGSLACENESEKELYLQEGLAIHEQCKKHGFESTLSVGNTLLDMYSNCRAMDLSRTLFQSMSTRDVVSWNCMMLGYVENGEALAALDLFSCLDCEPDCVTFLAALKACGSLASSKDLSTEFILEKGVILHEQAMQQQKRRLCVNVVLSTSLVDMYCKTGRLDHAKAVFDGMHARDVVSWNCLILGYVDSGDNFVAMDMFMKMDCKPDSGTYVAILKACASLAADQRTDKRFWLEKAMQIHKQAREGGLHSNGFVACTLLDVYNKCGSMRHAQEVFDGMASRDIVAWNSIILGYADNGRSSVAMDLFTRMDCEPNYVTLISALKACSNLAALPVGQLIHAEVCRLGVEQEHVIASSLIDFYGNSRNLSTAEHILSSMSSPDVVSWTALLAGYSSYGNTLQVFRVLVKMEKAGIQPDGVTFLCILTACSHAGKVEQGRDILQSMPEHGVRPAVEHYNCVVDMLGRANRLEEAVQVIRGMEFEANSETWMTLLGACKIWKNVDVGKVAFDELMASREAGDFKS